MTNFRLTRGVPLGVAGKALPKSHAEILDISGLPNIGNKCFWLPGQGRLGLVFPLGLAK